MELWDLYDSNRIKTDKTWVRDSKEPTNITAVYLV